MDLYGGLESVENVRAGGRENAFGAEQILDGERDAIQRASVSRGPARIGRVGVFQRAFRRLHDESVKVARAFHRREMRLRKLPCREILRRQPVAGLGNGETSQFRHMRHSITLGTTK